MGVKVYAKLVVPQEEAKGVLKKLDILDDAELEDYYCKTYSVNFPNGNVAEIWFCFDGSGWAEGYLFNEIGEYLYHSEPTSEFFGVWHLVDGKPTENHNTYVIEVVQEGDVED